MGTALLGLVVITIAWPMIGLPADWAPTSAFAAPAPDGGVLVSWTPGPEPADVYRVYGVSAGELVLLSEQPAASGSTVLIGVEFSSYGVSGVENGVESVVVPAVLIAPLLPCHVWIDTSPPGYFTDCPLPGKPVRGPDLKIRVDS
ncbi:MAG TPA: hypothetical protein VHH36_09550 [Candidatus Thermoplasmatota archaeon]|nr:hypothetical protein [Candidatus Thermoplasmatota archaeon]